MGNTRRWRLQALMPMLLLLATACWRAQAEPGDLCITELGKIGPGLSTHDEQHGTMKKWTKVQELLGEQSGHVVIKHLATDLGGNTSVRNELPLQWKDKGYFRRARDLGQVFTAPYDFTLTAIVLRTGPAHLAFLPGAAGAEVFVQFFEVAGTPVINDNGTPPGTHAKHGFSTNHRCDDFLEGVAYRPLRVVKGGRLPDLTTNGDGRLTYMKWAFTGPDALRFERGKRYAFMVGFVEAGPERNFALANHNDAGSPLPPALNDADHAYDGGWAIRREGNGRTPPLMIPGDRPPSDPAKLDQLKAESAFPEGDAHYAISPTTRGFPDVDTYRDHEFYILARPERQK